MDDPTPIRRWFVYTLKPFGFAWRFAPTLRQAMLHLANYRGREYDLDREEIVEFVDFWAQAKEAASAAGWSGGFFEEPCCFWLPGEDLSFGFVFQDDSPRRLTYVIAPEPMPWLEYDNLDPFRRPDAN